MIPHSSRQITVLLYVVTHSKDANFNKDCFKKLTSLKLVFIYRLTSFCSKHIQSQFEQTHKNNSGERQGIKICKKTNTENEGKYN